MERYNHKWWALVGISILAFTAYLDYTIVNTALPFIQRDLQTNVLDLQWVSNIFAIILAMTQIAFGKFADRWGRKKIFFSGVCCFGIAALGCGLSPTIGWLIFFRALQGLGASVLFVCSVTLVSDSFPQHERSKAIGIFAAITGLGFVLGPFFGGLLISFLSWRWVFWINLPLIAMGLPGAFLALKSVVSETSKVRIDWMSLFLLVAGLGSFIYGIISSGKSGWTLPSSWLPLFVGFSVLFLLIVLDLKKENPLISLHIFKNHLISLNLINCVAGGIVTSTFLFFDPLYLENVRHLPAFQIGLWIAIIPVGQVFISLFFHTILKRIGCAKFALISIVTATLAILFHWGIGENTPLFYLILPFVLIGITWGVANTNTITAINLSLPPSKIGDAIGTLYTSWNVGGAIFLSLGTAVFHISGKPFVPAFHLVSAINFVAMLLFTMVAFIIYVSACRMHKHRR
jgi:EmrB/QacA subfamily drug resistance transporter